MAEEPPRKTVHLGGITNPDLMTPQYRAQLLQFDKHNMRSRYARERAAAQEQTAHAKEMEDFLMNRHDREPAEGQTVRLYEQQSVPEVPIMPYDAFLSEPFDAQPSDPTPKPSPEKTEPDRDRIAETAGELRKEMGNRHRMLQSDMRHLEQIQQEALEHVADTFGKLLEKESERRIVMQDKLQKFYEQRLGIYKEDTGMQIHDLRREMLERTRPMQMVLDAKEKLPAILIGIGLGLMGFLIGIHSLWAIPAGWALVLIIAIRSSD